MVVHRYKTAILCCLLPLIVLFLEACTVDVFGFVVSTGLNGRLRDKDTFNFLSEADRNLQLKDEYSFIVVSDTHIEDGDARRLEQLAQVIDDSGDAFVVITGDITQYGKRADIQKFIEIARSLKVPCYPVIGNHDIYFDNWREWKDLIGSTSYRIGSPGGSTTLFILDSANATFGDAQLDWLDRELKSANPRVFVFTHTNLLTRTPGDLVQLMDVRERSRIMNILKGRADAVFMGHLHNRIERKLGGVHYITLEDYRDNRTYCRVYVSPGGFRYVFKKL
jgi:3',5'-cyclic AMP phosphodiesterase CpdA